MPGLNGEIVKGMLKLGGGAFSWIVPARAVRVSQMIMGAKISGVMGARESAPVKVMNGVIAETSGAVAAAVLMNNDCANLFYARREPEVKGGRDT